MTNQNKPPVEGFVWIEESDARFGLFGAVQAGDTVHLPVLRPPWIVVNHSLERVLVTAWPGRLLRARVLPPETAEEREAFAQANSNLAYPPFYTRAFAVEILEERPSHILFGRSGDPVGQVITAAHTLDARTAALLAASSVRGEDDAYSAVWSRWLGAEEAAPARSSAVLAVSGRSAVSPVGHGLSVIHSEVERAARHASGAGAFSTDEDGDLSLNEPWSTASRVLRCAALAFGAPEFVEDRAPLVAAWNAVYR